MKKVLSIIVFSLCCSLVLGQEATGGFFKKKIPVAASVALPASAPVVMTGPQSVPAPVKPATAAASAPAVVLKEDFRNKKVEPCSSTMLIFFPSCLISNSE